MSRKLNVPSVVLLLTTVVFCSSQAIAQPRPKKKIVEYGWDVPYPDFVRENIDKMEKRPFDGIIFRTGGQGRR